MSTPHDPQSPPPLTVLPADRPPPPRPRMAFWGGLFRGAFVLVFLASISLNALIFIVAFMFSDSETSLHQHHHSGQKGAHDRVAVIKIDGILLEGLTSFAQKQIEAAAKD